MKEIQLAVLDSAVRWCNNILTEARANHGRVLSPYKQEKLKEACLALQEMLGPDPIPLAGSTSPQVRAGQTWVAKDNGIEFRVTIATNNWVHLGEDHQWPMKDFLDRFTLVKDVK